MLSDLNLPGPSINNIEFKIKAIIVSYNSKLNNILKSEKNETRFTGKYIPQQVICYPNFLSLHGDFKTAIHNFPT